ncbi:MAG TPA: AlkA N-terminal domain-containing protein [Casimicrobiaceae bacterium]|jgi:AraC family transcriptional regulator of adaptative response / DNA-3-methyladenine glycosylase II
MVIDAQSCYRALATHDARFDGRFFVGVSSTRIYCRPVCRVRTPRPEHCRYFASAAAAEVAGYRPCLRCRPELAPGFASVDATERLAQAAVELIDGGVLEDGGLERLARRLGVTSRHVRRIFERAFGVTPVEYAQTQKLLLAKRLLTDTALPITEVALASGFNSVRRFNALWKARYRMPPTRLRRDSGAGAPGDVMRFELAYRPPYDWDAMHAFLAARAIAGVEDAGGQAYRRTIAVAHRGSVHTGWLRVRPAARRPALVLEMSPSLAHVVPLVLARVRHLFDLSCHPDEVAGALGDLAAGATGLRLPGTTDGFELAVRAVVGQQVSVRSARTLLGRIAARFGEPVAAPDGLTHVFPTASRIAEIEGAELASLGVLPARARTLVALARAVADGEVDLQFGAPVDAMREALERIPGIGPWTVEYIAMRALGWPDAFPAGDHAVLKALGATRAGQAQKQSESWRPWRAYAVMHLWKGMA